MTQPYKPTLQDVKDSLSRQTNEQLQETYNVLKRITGRETVCGLILDEMASRCVKEFQDDWCAVKPEEVPERLWERYMCYYDCVDDPVDFNTWVCR